MRGIHASFHVTDLAVAHGAENVIPRPTHTGKALNPDAQGRKTDSR